MILLLFFLCVLASTLVNFFSKQYNEKAKAYNIWLFSGMTMLGAFFFFFMQAGFKIRFSTEILPISLIFTLGYAATMGGSILAYKKGPFSITSLIHAYSIVPPVLFFLFVLGEKISPIAYVGIFLLIISILFLYDKKEGGTFSRGWLFWVVVSFTGNSICAIMMKMQVELFGGTYKNEMMLYALVILMVFFMVLGLAKARNLKKEMRDAAAFGLVRGALNGISTLFSLILLELIPAAISNPLIAGGGIVASFVIAIVYYREKLTKLQLIGYLLGTASVVLLNM